MRAFRPVLIGFGVVLLAPLQARPGELNAAEREAELACSRLGPGFHAVPSTTTCVRVGGSARLEVGTAESRSGAWGATSVASGRTSVDVRTDTGLGPARAFVEVGAARAAARRPLGGAPDR